MWSTLNIGILKIAPDEDLIVSPLIGELPDFEIIIPFIPMHSAVLTIAPKFFVSVTLSSIKKLKLLSIIDFSREFKSKVLIGEIVATIP